MARTGFELQNLIARLGGDHSWEALDQLTGQMAHPDRKKLADEDEAMRKATRLSFQKDLRDVFSSPAGKRVLEQLVAGTIGRPPVSFGTLGLSADQVGVMSAYRDGQNTVIHSLLVDLEKSGFDPSTVGEDNA